MARRAHTPIGKLRVGDIVRLVGLPALDGMSARGRRESAPVFQHIVGTYKRIKGFDDEGKAELTFRIKRGRHAGLHAVGIELELLRLRRSRAR